MDHNYEDIVLMERYVERSLNEEETLTVERRLSQEPSLRELYRQEQLLVNGIRFGHLKNQLESLQELERTLPAIDAEEKTTKVIALNSYWKALAVAATLVIGVGIYMFINRSVAPTDLYAQNFALYPNIFQVTTRGTPEEDAWSAPYTAYDRKDFVNAARGFNEMWKAKESLPSKYSKPGILLLLGNSNLMLGRTEEAKDNFITLSKDFKDFGDLSKWYLGLCYLKMGKSDGAKVLLEEIAGGKSSYKLKAREMLKKMN